MEKTNSKGAPALSDFKKCIICMNEFEKNDLTEEHIFPQACGGTLTIRRLCKDCNSLLGQTVDAALSNSIIGELYKTSREPSHNPFKKATATNEHGQFRIQSDASGMLKPYMIPSKPEFISDSNGTRIRLSVDASDKDKIPEILRKSATRKGLNMPNISDDLLNNLKIERAGSPKFELPFQLDTNLIQTALLKIAYELTFYFLGESYLLDPVAQELQKLLYKVSRGETVDFNDFKINGSVFGADFLKKPPFPKADNVGLMFEVRGRLSCSLVLFGSLDFCAIVSSSINRYPHFQSQIIFNDYKKDCKTHDLIDWLENQNISDTFSDENGV